MKKELFIRVFRNKVLFIRIFEKVQSIHRDFLQIKNQYKWEQLLEQQLHILAYHNYLSALRDNVGYRNCLKLIHEVGPKYSRKYGTTTGEPLFYAIKGDSVDVLEWSIRNYHGVLISPLQGFHSVVRYRRGDLMYFASLFNSIKSIKYLDSEEVANIGSSLSSNWSWNYLQAFLVSPISINIEIFQYYASKVIDLLPVKIKVDDLLLPLHKRMVNVAFNAARVGSLEMLKMFLQYSNLENIEQLLEIDSTYINPLIENAIDGGHLHIIQFVCSSLPRNNINSNISFQGRTISISSKLIYLSIEKNQLEILKFLHPFIEIGPESSLDYVLADNLEMIQWLHENRNVNCSVAMGQAISKGYLEITQWLHNNRTEGCSEYDCNIAIKNNNLEMVKWLNQNRTEGFSPFVIDCYADVLNLEMLEYLFSIPNIGCTTMAMDTAAINGNFKVLQWLHKNRTEGCTTDAMNFAAKNGHIKIVKWLHENRTEGCTTDAMDFAVTNGHLEIVKWLHQNRTEGCSINMFDKAGLNNHIEIVKWLLSNRSHGFSFNGLKSILNSGHYEIINLLREKEIL